MSVSCCPDRSHEDPARRRPPEIPGACASGDHCILCRAGAYGDFQCPHGLRDAQDASALARRDMPSLLRRAQTFFAALARESTHRFAHPQDVAVTQASAHSRLAICATCPQITTDQWCRACGCYLPAKVRFVTQTCPTGRW